MWRKPVVRAGTARAWEVAREQFSAVVSERDQLKRELDWTKRDLAMTQRSLDDSIAAIQELRAATQARWHAEERCRELYRERAIARARAAERNPTQPLQ